MGIIFHSRNAKILLLILTVIIIIIIVVVVVVVVDINDVHNIESRGSQCDNEGQVSKGCKFSVTSYH